jgi:hypothetical protein
MGACKWCGGTGRQYVEEGSSLNYVCPDCDGQGYLPECDNCGEEYSGEYCEKCYAECEECGEVVLISELNNGFCADCVEVM